MPIASYSTGTVAVSAGDTVIAGTGSVWSGVNARAGDDIVIAGHTVIVEDVTDATHLVIDPWPYANVPAGTAYKIVQRSPLRFSGGDAMADVDRLVAVLNGMGTIYAVAGDAPDPSIGEDGQYALKTNTGAWKLWLKEAGAWVPQGIPVGTSYRGAWSSVENYAGNDIVTVAGSGYVAKGPNTNRPPASSPDVWDLLAAKGDQGNKGDKGDTGTPSTIAVNSTVTLPPGSSATVANIGTASAASLIFGIPQGAQGVQGLQGPQGVGLQPDATGTLSDRATHDGEAKGFKFLQTDVSPFRLYVKASNTSGDWAGPTFIGGSAPVGDLGSTSDPVFQIVDLGTAV